MKSLRKGCDLGFTGEDLLLDKYCEKNLVKSLKDNEISISVFRVSVGFYGTF